MEKVLIANRGEIAVRIMRTCRVMGIETVAVHSAPDAASLHVAMADSSVALEGDSAAETYLDHGKILDAAVAAAADAIHPGYGFLSENAAFARAVAERGLTWIGPSPASIEAMGDKVSARSVAASAGVSGVPGSPGPVEDKETIVEFGSRHGWPLVIKAAAGGGGRGMRVVQGAEELEGALEAARREASASFGDDRVYVERYLEWPRHVEVQILADAHGSVVALGQRDCSVQRRHQKLVEEAPAPSLSEELRNGLDAAAIAIAQQVDYRGAGTVEFLVEGDQFFFLEVNTRLQVEHPVTEEIYGVDLVAEQLRIAAGEPISAGLGDLTPRGHAIECRINAEDPAAGRFLPSPGRITRLDVPSGPGVRFDCGYRSGDEVSQFYDNLVGKLIVWGEDRTTATRAMLVALSELRIEGIATTASAASVVLSHPDFVAVEHATPWLEQRVDLPAATDRSLAVEQEAVAERVVWVNERRYILEPPLTARTESQPTEKRSAAAAPSDAGPRSSRRGKASDGTMLAPMQGTVIKVAVAAGDTVSQGDLICVLEAMKMENEIVAPHAGVVADLRVTPGQGVSAGEVLFVVQASGPEQ